MEELIKPYIYTYHGMGVRGIEGTAQELELELEVGFVAVFGN